MVTSDTEIIEEEEEPKEGETEAGSQTDVPAATEVWMVALSPLFWISCGWRL